MNNNNTGNHDTGKTALGLGENLEALLCYLLTWVSGILFLILDRDNKKTRFHAFQSIFTFLPLFILSYAAEIIPFLGGLVAFAIRCVGVILWIMLMYKAFKGERYKVPFAGEIAEQQANK